MSERLKKRLMEEIRERGPISFAEFMEAALYDPEDGFYAEPPVGADRHFVTSPHVSPAFGALLGRQVAEVWDRLERPASLDVVELGAGDGRLAQQILEATRSVPELAAAVRYVGVERSAGARAALRARGLEAADHLPERIEGCVIANEVLDNVPFHRLREHDGRTVEVRVGTDGDRLVEVEMVPAREALSGLRAPLRPGEERPVSPAAAELVQQTAAALERGYAFWFDYGRGPEGTSGPVHAYRAHDVLAEVIEDPGSRDITAAVDWGAVASAAEASGLTVWGPAPQRDALLALGFQLWTSGVRARQAKAESAGDWRGANRLYAQRSAASVLVDEQKLGGLELLVLGTHGLEPPAAVLGERDTSR